MCPTYPMSGLRELPPVPWAHEADPLGEGPSGEGDSWSETGAWSEGGPWGEDPAGEADPLGEGPPQAKAVVEPEAALTEQEWEYLASVQGPPGLGSEGAWEHAPQQEWQQEEWEDEDARAETALLDGEQDPGVVDLAEKVAARAALRELEEERPDALRRAPRASPRRKRPR